jgi:hypothetical protein
MPTAETESPAQNAESAPAPRPQREKDRVDSFARRHIGPNQQARAAMLAELEFENLDALIDATVPKNIRLDHALNLPEAKSEWDALAELRHLARKNVVARSFIGAGYSDTITPPVIQRNILENPGWYTQYTPYQAEIAQGRLEALMNFQTLVADLTALPVVGGEARIMSDFVGRFTDRDIWDIAAVAADARDADAAKAFLCLAMARLGIAWKRPRYDLARRAPTWRQAKGGSNGASQAARGR